MRNQIIDKTAIELAKREISEHLGRWCEVKLKKTGELVKVIRTGYGPMERPERDSHRVEINGEVIGKFNDLYEVAKWMCER